MKTARPGAHTRAGPRRPQGAVGPCPPSITMGTWTHGPTNSFRLNWFDVINRVISTPQCIGEVDLGLDQALLGERLVLG